MNFGITWQCMHHLGFLPCPADLDIWMKPMVRPDDGFNNYAYVLIYVDAVMVIHHDSNSILIRIDNYFNLKPSLIGETYIYLGSKLNKMRLENGVWAWANSPVRYVNESVANVDKYLVELVDLRWNFYKNKADNPFVGDYAPEMNEIPVMEQEL